MSEMSFSSQANSLLSFKSFLSHRYKSPNVNLYFFNLFAEMAEVQFEVDEGTFATNVTRLERMVRDADAFIGIYPFPGSWEEAQLPEELRKASRYFRLELDLAIRSRKPALVFYDARYRELMKPPNSILFSQFDSNEVTGSGGFPQAGKHRKLFEEFCDIVTASRSYDVARLLPERTRVGIIVPQDFSGQGNYTPECVGELQSILRTHGFDDLHLLCCPPILDRSAFALFEKMDWAIIDISEQMAATGIPAYLHGRFIPMIRIKHVPQAESTSATPFENALYGGVEVGYSKDIVSWSDVDSLKKGLEERLTTLKADVKRISTIAQATEYFRGAALRKEAIFLSYSGKDQDIAADLRIALTKCFHKVFDYRDGTSIRAGQPWLKEIFEQLSSSAIGIQLLSKNYFESGNCTHEAEQMVAQLDNKKLKLISVKLYKESLDLPPWLENVQYLRMSEYRDADEIVKEIVRLISTET